MFLQMDSETDEGEVDLDAALSKLEEEYAMVGQEGMGQWC